MIWTEIDLRLARNRCSELMGLAVILPVNRADCVSYMNAIMESAGYGFLTAQQGSEFDALSARVKEIDAYLPVLAREIAEANSVLAVVTSRFYAEQADAARKNHLRKAARERRSEKKIKKEKALQQIQPIQPGLSSKMCAPAWGKRWRDWGSSVEPVELVVAVTESEPVENSRTILTDDLDRCAKATMSWAPWNRRARYSRRYEGFSHQPYGKFGHP